MDAKKVLVLLPVTEAQKHKLEAAAPEALFHYVPPEAITREIAKEAQIIIGNLPVSWVGECAKLEWIQSNFAGVGKLGEPGFLPEHILLTNGSGAYGEAIGEYLLTMLLSMMKKFNLYRDMQRLKLWTDLGPVRTIMGSSVLVVGLGDIGRAFARRVHAMGGYVTGIRRQPGALDARPDYVQQIRGLEWLDTLLPEADAVALCLPDTLSTRGLMTRERLLGMKKDAFFLNVGRGNVVDNAILAEVLASGHLAGAAMDVTEPEPLPEDHPLWTIPNMLLTPHVAGQFHLDDILEKVVEISCANLARFLSGQPLLNLVDKDEGYRRSDGQWKSIQATSPSQ